MGKIISAGLAAFAGAGCAFMLVVFITAAFIGGEASYGWGLIFSPLAALITGAVIFVVVLRRFSAPIILSEKMVSVLSALTYRPDAEWEVNTLPFGSIFWKDEMPPLADLFDRPEDMSVIHSMFGIRLKIWDGEALGTDEQRLWDSVKHQVPQWALFNRLPLTDEQKAARSEAEHQVQQAFESLGNEKP